MRYRSAATLSRVIAGLIALCAFATGPINVRAQTGAQSNQAVLTSQSQIAAFSAAFSPNGRLVVTGGALQKLLLWDVVWGIPVHAFYGHQTTVTLAAYSPDGKRIASYGGNLLLWDAATGALVRELDGFSGGEIGALAFSKDGTQLLSYSAAQTQETFIQVWNPATGALVKETPGPPAAWPSYAAFSPDGHQLAYKFELRDNASCTFACPKLGLWNVTAGAEVSGFQQTMTPTTHSYPQLWSRRIVFSSDGRSIVAVYDGSVIRILDASSGALIRDMEAPSSTSVEAIALSPDGKVIAALINGQVALWNANTGVPIVPPASGNLLPGLAFLVFSQDGQRIVSGDWSGKPGADAFRIWNAASGELIMRSSALPEGNWFTEFFDRHYRASKGAAPYLKITEANRDLPLAPYKNSFQLPDAPVSRLNAPVRQAYVCSNINDKLPALLRVYACTDVIESGWWTGNDLAWAYNDRCWAYVDFLRNISTGSPGTIELAIADCNEAIKRDPKNAVAYFNLGDVYRIEAKHDQAVANYTKAIGLDAAFVSAFNNRGLAYFASNDFDHAIADYTAALNVDGRYARALSNRGDVYLSKGDLPDAIADYTKAIAIDPTFVQPFAGRCKAYEGQKNDQLAAIDCAEARRLSPVAR